VQNAIPKEKNSIPSDSSSGPRETPAIERAVERALAQQRATYSAEAERLVQAALALIRESGQLEPPVAAIVRRAGLSNQAFYRHFRSKHELLVAVLDHGIALLAEYLEARMAEATSPIERVRAWIRGMLDQALHPRGAEATRPFALARSLLAQHYPEEVASSERRLTALVRSAIDEARQARELPEADPATDAETLYHLTMGWLEARLGEEEVEASAAQAARLEAFAMAGLRAEHP
jgi:AcrR family transcriptional regulator